MIPESSHPGRWWHALDDGRIQCDLCPRDCKLHEGQRGACFVRKMQDGRMVLTTYGRSSGFCVDPIEKKPLNHFYPGSSVLSFGTAGCNLACKFCQNWDISKSREMDRLMDQATPQMIADSALRLGCRSVAFTYNDPVIFAEYAMDVADACHAGREDRGGHRGLYAPEPRREFYAKMDAANVDLKAFTEEFYFKLTGAHLQPVLDTLVYLAKETDVWVEITTLLIPGKNDSEDEIEAECQWIAREPGPRRAAAFHRLPPRLQDARRAGHACCDAQARARNRAARRIALRLHRQRPRRGGRHHPLPGCEEAVIVRDWYEIRAYHLTDEGACAFCGHRLAGRYGKFGKPFGARRIPVRLALGA